MKRKRESEREREPVMKESVSPCAGARFRHCCSTPWVFRAASFTVTSYMSYDWLFKTDTDPPKVLQKSLRIRN